jgi:hypothetical protein
MCMHALTSKENHAHVPLLSQPNHETEYIIFVRLRGLHHECILMRLPASLMHALRFLMQTDRQTDRQTNKQTMDIVQVLGKPLDKREQTSDWNVRPLSEQQVGPPRS